MKFLVGIVGYDVLPHARCFEDFVRALVACLRGIGHEVEYASAEAREKRPGRLIMFGANNVEPNAFNAMHMPADAICYNTEQLAAFHNPLQMFQGYDLYRNRVVWDYSQSNFNKLLAIGVKRPVLCPLGYHPSMERAVILNTPADKQDIDVLFYGSINPRRRKVLDALDAAGLCVMRVIPPAAIYGEERDALIARAKVVLNMHFYENGVFEIFRVSHLLANAKCVVNEAGGCDDQLETFAAKATRYEPIDRIVDACRILCADGRERRIVAERGRELFKQIDFMSSVRRAVEAS